MNSKLNNKLFYIKTQHAEDMKRYKIEVNAKMNKEFEEK